MASTTTYRRGHVVVVEVPYSDFSGAKRRPALVVSAEAFHRTLPDLIVCPISSLPRFHQNPGPGDLPLTAWREVGLRHPSTVRISKMLAIDKTIVKKRIGRVATEDLVGVERTLSRALGLRGAVGKAESRVKI